MSQQLGERQVNIQVKVYPWVGQHVLNLPGDCKLRGASRGRQADGGNGAPVQGGGQLQPVQTGFHIRQGQVQYSGGEFECGGLCRPAAARDYVQVGEAGLEIGRDGCKIYLAAS